MSSPGTGPGIDDAPLKNKRRVLVEAASGEAWAAHKENYLALAGVSFASILALACLGDLSAWQRAALFCFSIGLPTNIDTYIKSRRSQLHFMKMMISMAAYLARVFIGVMSVSFGIFCLVAHHSLLAAILFIGASSYIVLYSAIHKKLGIKTMRTDETISTTFPEFLPERPATENEPASPVSATARPEA